MSARRAAALALAAALSATLIIAVPRSWQRSWEPLPHARAPRHAVHRAVSAAALGTTGSAEQAMREAVRLMLGARSESTVAELASAPALTLVSAQPDVPPEPVAQPVLLWPPTPPPEAPALEPELRGSEAAPAARQRAVA